MDAAGEEELILGLDAIVTASKVTEDVASLATSLELATGEGDFDLLMTGESTLSTSHSKSRLTPDGRLGDPVDFFATFFNGEESSPLKLTRSRFETSVRSRISKEVELEGVEEEDSVKVTCTKQDDFSVIIGESKMVLSHFTLS